MKVYSIVDKDLQSAIAQAKVKHGSNIQVLYEREVLYGVFAKKWIEIGYYVKGSAPTVPLLSRSDDEYYEYLETEKKRLFALMISGGYSYDFSCKMLDLFISSRLATKVKYTPSDNDEFVYKNISLSLKYDYETSSQVPYIFSLIFPYPCDKKRVVDNILSFYSNSGRKNLINVINISENPVVAKNDGYTYNCKGIDGLEGIVSNLSDCQMVLVLPDSKYSYDEDYYRTLANLKNSLGTKKISSYAVIPFYLRYLETKKLYRISDRIRSLIVSDYVENESFGNIVSVADRLEKEILFFENAQGIHTPKMPKLNALDRLVF